MATGQSDFITNRSFFLKGYPDGFPEESLFELREKQLSTNLSKDSGDVLVKVLYFSLDPHMRNQMRPPQAGHAQGYGGFSLQEPLLAGAIGVIYASENESFRVGDLVQGNLGWEDYSLVRKAEGLTPLKPNDLPLSYHLGVLGMQGLTAYAGLLDIGAPKAGETVYVSSASGAVGQIVGQLAKLRGARVVGSAGSDEKVKLLKTTFGYDEAFNYKDEPDLGKALARFCPNGIDVYFENVGGAMLDAVLQNVNVHARIVVCGMVSQYNLEEKDGIRNIIHLIVKRVKMQGFLVNDYFGTPTEGAFAKDMPQWLKEGKIKYVEDIYEGLESSAKAFIGLLKGHNVGKVIVHVADQ